MSNPPLVLPVAPGVTMGDIMRRVSGVRPDGSVPTTPLWEWEMVVLGLERAIDRYSLALNGGRGIDARIAAGEALWWVSAADEFLRTRVSQMKAREYYPAIAKTEDGAMLAGLAFLRNRAGHQLTVALDVQSEPKNIPFEVVQEDGTVQSHHLTGVVRKSLNPHDFAPLSGFFFQDFKKLPPADQGHDEKSGRDICYADVVAGRSVDEVLRKALQTLRDLIEIERPSPDKVSMKINAQLST